MTYDQIVARLIRYSIEKVAIPTHERVLLGRYEVSYARAIVEELLLDDGTTVQVGLPEDDGSTSSAELPAVRWGNGGHLEILPFVVTDGPRPGDPLWLGSQGFASRLRTSFHLKADADVVRVLLIFDTRPVETEQTTTSVQLAAAIDSLDSLVDWFSSPYWSTGFVPSVHQTALRIVRWWRDQLDGRLEWNDENHQSRLERGATFMEECRAKNSAAEIGHSLPVLGLLFRDPELLNAQEIESRLNQNADLAVMLDATRRQRTLDPQLEADRIIDLGDPAEPFYEHLVDALHRIDRPITQTSVTFAEVASRRRTGQRRPAWLDVRAIEVVALGNDRNPDGPALPWRWLNEVALPPDANATYELVIPCPTNQVRVTLPIEGDLRAFLYRDGVFQNDVGDEEGGLTPGGSLTQDLDRPEAMSVVELVLREKKPGRGRLARPTQVLRIGIIADNSLVVPEASVLDPDDNAFVVDGAADSINVQVGRSEVRVSDGLPPIDGSVSEVCVDGVTFRWRGEDRSPPVDHDESPRKKVRLLELVGLRARGDPRDSEPYYTEDGGLAATCGTSAILDVDATSMRQESALLLDPQSFVGMGADNSAAADVLQRAVPDQFNAWIESRIEFFRQVVVASEHAITVQGGQRPTMYLADLRDEVLEGLAWNYVSTYGTLLDAIAETATTSANGPLIEPALFCDRTDASADTLRLAPTHPVSVALLASIQRAFLGEIWPATEDRNSLERLLGRPLLDGVLPWVPWRGKVLEARPSSGLLWRCYGTDGGVVDTSFELGPVVIQKIKRLLSLAPHLNVPSQRIYVNVEIGRGTGRYLVHALRELERDNNVRCAFDVGVVSLDDQIEPEIVKVFSNDPISESASPLREKLHGFARVCLLAGVSDRPAHLVFRMEAAHSNKDPFASMAGSHTLVRETGFAAGLSQEPARFATTTANEVTYTRYVGSSTQTSAIPRDLEEDTWGGRWRRQFLQLCGLTRRAAVGLQSEIGPDSIPCQRLRQIAEADSSDQYDNSFITVHCDPAQGPEFFVGARTSRSGVFLVECSDRGAPELPGNDIVAVTSRIGPFRAALRTAVGTLPNRLNELVDDDVARGLLRDINLLRGTEVFDFLREISRQTSHIYFMDGLDNVLAFRFLMSPAGQLPGYLPAVIALKDFTARCEPLADLRRGTQCDDILVFYLPRFQTTPTILYRLVEVKFGPRSQQWSKAQQQLSQTAAKLTEKLPENVWNDERSPTALLLERDIAWILLEVLERYRAFGLLPPDEQVEESWGFQGLFQSLQKGDFCLRPYAPSEHAGDLVNGTAMMLDPDIPGTGTDVSIERATEYLTIHRDLIADLLVAPVEAAVAAETDQANLPPAPSSPVAATADTDRAPSGPSGLEDQELDQSEIDDQPPEAPGGNAENAPPPEPSRDRNASSSSVDRERIQSRVNEVFDGFIGNDGPVTRLKRALTITLLEGNEWLDPVGLFGPKSTGKTELAGRVAEALRVPRAEVSETTLRSADDLASKIQQTADESGAIIRNEIDANGATILRAPPMVVFIDEVHLLRPRVQDSLLKAMEPDDRTLISNLGTFDTRQVTFIVATTHPGNLGAAFRSRVSRYELAEYDLSELVRILAAHRERRSDIAPEASQFSDECLAIFARVGRLVPREALRLMRDAASAVRVGFIDPTPESLRKQYREEYGADDELGLRERDRDYLRVLFPDQVFGVEALAAQLGMDTHTLSDDLEPYLLRLGLIELGRRGRNLTRRGRELVSSFQD